MKRLQENNPAQTAPRTPHCKIHLYYRIGSTGCVSYLKHRHLAKAYRICCFTARHTVEGKGFKRVACEPWGSFLATVLYQEREGKREGRREGGWKEGRR
ncbi:hypothetical protein L345_11684, partial [Ophiophagus hannah]